MLADMAEALRQGDRRGRLPLAGLGGRDRRDADELRVGPGREPVEPREVELRPGAVVSERELMERLAIGRTPMHEALHRLAREKFIEVYPRRGMFVTTVEIRDLAALSEVRLALEAQAAKLAASRVTADDRAEIAAVMPEFHVVGRPHRELMELDERIHRLVYRIARNEFLETTAEQYYVPA